MISVYFVRFVLLRFFIVLTYSSDVWGVFLFPYYLLINSKKKECWCNDCVEESSLILLESNTIRLIRCSSKSLFAVAKDFVFKNSLLKVELSLCSLFRYRRVNEKIENRLNENLSNWRANSLFEWRIQIWIGSESWLFFCMHVQHDDWSAVFEILTSSVL